MVTEMKDFLVINIDTESETGKPVAERFGVGPLPTLLFLNPDGSVRDAILGYLPPAGFKKEVQRIRRDEGTIGDLRRKAEAAPKDVDKRIAYANKLKESGDTKGYQAQVDEVLKLDPERKNPKTGELVFDRLMSQVEGLWTEKKFDEIPGLIQAHLATEKNPELLFKGWATLANIHEELGRQARKKRDDDGSAKHAAGALTAKMEAFKNAPEKVIVPFGNELAWNIYEKRDEVTPEQKAFALDVVKRLQPLAEKAKDSNALDTVACVYHWHGMKDEALAALRKASELDPDNEDISKRLKEFGG